MAFKNEGLRTRPDPLYHLRGRISPIRNNRFRSAPFSKATEGGKKTMTSQHGGDDVTTWRRLRHSKAAMTSPIPWKETAAICLWVRLLDFVTLSLRLNEVKFDAADR